MILIRPRETPEHNFVCIVLSSRTSQVFIAYVIGKNNTDLNCNRSSTGKYYHLYIFGVWTSDVLKLKNSPGDVFLIVA